MPKRIDASVDSHLEPTVDELLRYACEGGNSYLSQFSSFDEIAQNNERILAYLAAVHKGFAAAQEIVFSRILRLHAISAASRSSDERGEEIVLRKVIDAIAWQMIDRELYIARRLYRGESPPSLVTSNAESALDVARSIAGQEFDRFGLLSDLTSFVQHGDILAVGTRRARLEIIEVKDGQVNETILEFLATMPEGTAEAAFQSFRSVQGEKAFEQLRRVVRQKERGAAISQLLTNERGVDPNLDIEVRIGSTPFAVELYDNRLSAIIDASVERGWAIDVIDDCLFLGAYRGVMRFGAEHIFSPWFQSTKPSRESPIVDLVSSLTTPLALPPFARFIRRDQALDLVFGRCRVMLGINIPVFVELIRNCGVTVRPATKKERSMFSRGRPGLLISDGQAIIVESGGAKIALNDGCLLRMLYHGVSPKAAAEMCALPPEALTPST